MPLVEEMLRLFKTVDTLTLYCICCSHPIREAGHDKDSVLSSAAVNYQRSVLELKSLCFFVVDYFCWLFKQTAFLLQSWKWSFSNQRGKSSWQKLFLDHLLVSWFSKVFSWYFIVRSSLMHVCCGAFSWNYKYFPAVLEDPWQTFCYPISVEVTRKIWWF